MKIATWNVNSVRARLEHLVTWLQRHQPEVVLLQELKTVEATFPREALEDLGYNCAVNGQKAANGVAILSRQRFDEIIVGQDLGFGQEARWLEAVVNGRRFVSVYVPNGQSLDSERYPYKLNFLEKFYQRTAELLQFEEILVIGGDLNIAPTPHDVYDPAAINQGEILCSLPERQGYHQLINLGLTDPLAVSSGCAKFTWWDYRAGKFERGEGMRIDFLLLSPEASDCLVQADVDMEPRGWDRPSDHAPVVCELRID